MLEMDWHHNVRLLWFSFVEKNKKVGALGGNAASNLSSPQKNYDIQ